MPLKAGFVDVTSEVKHPLTHSSDTVALRINGVEIITDSLGIKAIIEAIRNDRTQEYRAYLSLSW
jgi:hypothetical protein